MSKETKTASCQAIVSDLGISIYDLKCGNILNYDTAEGDILPSVIERQGLQWLSEDPKGFNLVHSPTPLTEELILKFGFQLSQSGYSCKSVGSDNLCYTIGKVNDREFIFTIERDGKLLPTQLKIKYVHELQNLHYSLTGLMLSLT